MPSIINNQEVFSRFFGKVQAYDFLDLSETQVNEFLCNWLSSSISKPHIRKLFSSISVDNETEEEITYTMKYALDEESDKDFIIEVLAYGILIEWLSPKINNVVTINQFFGSSDERYFSQASHLKEITALRDSAKKEQRSLISDRGYYWNTYLDGGQ